jgi:septum formation protein
MLILKSASPRRKQILSHLGLEFQVDPSSIDETRHEGERPLEYLRRVTIAKLNSPSISDTNIYVSSDTIVVRGEKMYPKPENPELALDILRELNGKKHSVFSGLGIFHKGEVIFEFDETEIEFWEWTETEIQNYIRKYRPFDKAGGYGIQDEEGPVKKYTGSYSNVMGFPLRKFFLYKEIWLPFWKLSKNV